MELRLRWFCIEASYFPMNPTGQKDCGGLGDKSGTQTVAIRHDGRFETSPISVSRRSSRREPRFHLRYGVFRNGTSLLATERETYHRTLATNQGYDIAERLRSELSRLRIVVGRRQILPVRLKAREGGGKIVDFDSLIDRYPMSYNYVARVIVWIGDSSESEPTTLSGNVKAGEVVLPKFELLQIGSEKSIPMSVLVEARIGLVKVKGEYVYYSAERRLSDLSLKIEPGLEAIPPANLLSEVDIIVEVN